MRRLGVGWGAGLVVTPGSVKTEGTVSVQLAGEREGSEAKGDTGKG